MAAWEVLSRAWGARGQPVVSEVWLKTKMASEKKRKAPPAPSLPASVASRPNPILLKRRLISFTIASSSGKTGFDGVCDFKLGQLTNKKFTES